MTISLVVALWDAALSTILAVAKLWEIRRDRFRVDVGYNFSGAHGGANKVIVRNLASRPVSPRSIGTPMHTGLKDLRWVYCHLLQFYAPPQGSWVVDETVDYFGTQPTHPLRSLGVFPSDEPPVEDVKHWHRSPP